MIMNYTYINSDVPYNVKKVNDLGKSNASTNVGIETAASCSGKTLVAAVTKSAKKLYDGFKTE